MMAGLMTVLTAIIGLEIAGQRKLAMGLLLLNLVAALLLFLHHATSEIPIRD